MKGRGWYNVRKVFMKLVMVSVRYKGVRFTSVIFMISSIVRRIFAPFILVGTMTKPAPLKPYSCVEIGG
jgi:hypothetical protein